MAAKPPPPFLAQMAAKRKGKPVSGKPGKGKPPGDDPDDDTPAGGTARPTPPSKKKRTFPFQRQ